MTVNQEATAGDEQDTRRAIYPPRPACPSCRSHSAERTGRSNAGYQRRRCTDCGNTWRVVAIGWIVSRPDGGYAVIPL